MDSNLPPTPPPIPPSPPPATPPPPPPAYAVPLRRVPPPRRNRGWKVAVIILAVLLGISVLFNFQDLLDGFSPPGITHTRRAGPELIETTVEQNHSQNKILVVPIEGVISSEMLEGGSYNMVQYI